jgi:predicted CXXCH cytochrome family protein
VDNALEAALSGPISPVTVVYAQSPTGSVSTAIGAATWATRFYRVTFGGADVDLFTMPQLEPVNGSDPEKVEVITGIGGAPATTIGAPSTPATLTGNSANGTIAAGPRPWVEGAPIFQYKGSSASPTVYYLHLDTNGAVAGSTASVWEKCDQSATGAVQTVTPAGEALDTVPAGTCSLLTTTDSEGQTVSLYGYKLLTAYPNHNYLSAESWGVAYRSTDQARWCGTCHPSKVSPDLGVEGEFAVDIAGVPTVFHSHPTACNYCHGSPTDGGSADFPHTSTRGVLLKEYPDALCLSCHTQGTLP